MKRRHSPRRLNLESLENREVPACTISLIAFDGNVLNIQGTARADTAIVRRVGADIVVTHRSAGDWADSVYRINASQVQAIRFLGGYGADQFLNSTNLAATILGEAGNDTLIDGAANSSLIGGDGNDTLRAGSGADRVVGGAGNDQLEGSYGNDTIEGGDGDDWLYGMAGNDRLTGGNGADHLLGGTGNDKLFGGLGYDWIFGNDGNDFMDAGSGLYAGELDGGEGTDINGRVWISGGVAYNDVFQGGGPSCWVESALSSIALREPHRIRDAISQVSEGVYRVTLWDGRGHSSPQIVRFEGEVFAGDAMLNPNQEGEFWTLIAQRAVLQRLGISLYYPSTGWPDQVLTFFTNRSTTTYGASSTGLTASDRTRIINTIAAGRNVVACTPASGPIHSTLVGNHCYTVMSVQYNTLFRQYTVTIRNPWGNDGSTSTSGDPNDGVITILWGDFSRSMSAYAVN
jgi:hypothetical protein